MKLPFGKEIVVQDRPDTKSQTETTEVTKEDEDMKEKKKGIGKTIALTITAIGAAGAAGFAAYKAYKSGDNDDSSDGYVDLPGHSDEDDEEKTPEDKKTDEE